MGHSQNRFPGLGWATRLSLPILNMLNEFLIDSNNLVKPVMNVAGQLVDDANNFVSCNDSFS